MEDDRNGRGKGRGTAVGVAVWGGGKEGGDREKIITDRRRSHGWISQCPSFDESESDWFGAVLASMAAGACVYCVYCVYLVI